MMWLPYLRSSSLSLSSSLITATNVTTTARTRALVIAASATTLLSRPRQPPPPPPPPPQFHVSPQTTTGATTAPNRRNHRPHWSQWSLSPNSTLDGRATTTTTITSIFVACSDVAWAPGNTATTAAAAAKNDAIRVGTSIITSAPSSPRISRTRQRIFHDDWPLCRSTLAKQPPQRLVVGGVRSGRANIMIAMVERPLVLLGVDRMRQQRGLHHSAASSSLSSSSLFSSLTTTTEPTTSSSSYLFSEDQKAFMEECRRLHASIMPLNEKFRGPLPPQSDQGTALPFVLLLGNHSSGKSSFLNYVVGRTIQTTGVAPTDDSFTLVAPGPVDRDQDGPAVIGDPDLGFQPLRQFGPTLMHHVQLKIRSNINSNFLIVDTPGMIDSPGNYMGLLQQQQQQWQQMEGFSSSSTNHVYDDSNGTVMDRGYDFTGVVRWLANRADVVLLFFDPDKPGTTGETLSVLLHALSGMDHKLLIVLNKADQFNRIHDFARAYGSLCWNLSKVIPRKDLPRIFTMCLPVQNRKENLTTTTTTTTTADNDKDGGSTENDTTSSKAALQDLYTARDEVVAEVRKAPARRMDNWITTLHDAVAQLLMHATLLEEIQTRYNRLYWQYKVQELMAATLGASLTALVALYGGNWFLAGAVTSSSSMLVAALATSTLLGTGGLWWYHGQQLQAWQHASYQRDELFQTFLSTHSRAVQEGDEYVAAIWQRIRPALVLALQQQQQGASTLPRVSNRELQQLQHILQQDIPRLRRMASPPHYGKV